MKKAICIFLCLCLSLCFLSGCSQDKEEPEEIIVTVNGKEFVAQQGEMTVSTPEIFELCRAFQLDPSEWPLDLGDCREYTVEPYEDTEKSPPCSVTPSGIKNRPMRPMKSCVLSWKAGDFRPKTE